VGRRGGGTGLRGERGKGPERKCGLGRLG
jgi:hypothetical protein